MGQMARSVPPSEFGLSRLSDWNPRTWAADPHARLQAALAVSFLLHLFVVVGVSVQRPAHKLDATHVPLIVDLVNSRTASAPQRPDILAQANLDGGGNTDEPRRARSPLPVTAQVEAQPDIALRARQAQPREQETPQVMTQSAAPAPALSQAESKPRNEAQPDAPPLPNASDLINSSREMVQLQAQIHRSLESYQKRPRRTFIGARAKEFRFARYIEDWRIRIERIGELNYPAAARGIYGTLQVSVSIRADGSLEGVEISRPSGKKVLDEAAIRIVRLAAPFAPFPPDIAEDTDILSITRTWSFTRADQFQAE